MPANTTDTQIFAFLHKLHVAGKTSENHLRKLECFTERRKKGKTAKQIAKDIKEELGHREKTIKDDIAAYTFHVETMEDKNIDHFTHYEELVTKNHYIEQNQYNDSFFKTIGKLIKTDKISATDVRDKLKVIIKPKRRDDLLKGNDFEDVYEKAKIEGATNVYIAKVTALKEWLNNNRDEFIPSELTPQTKSTLKIELKHLKRQLRYYAENVDEPSLFR